MNKIIFSLITILFAGCTSVDEDCLPGIYTSNKLKNNIDTLILKSDGTYLRKLYRKNSKELLLNQSNLWSYDGEYLDLKGYWLDNDKIYSNNMNFIDGVMGVSLLPKTRKSIIQFHYGSYEDDGLIYRKESQ